MQVITVLIGLVALLAAVTDGIFAQTEPSGTIVLQDSRAHMQSIQNGYMALETGNPEEALKSFMAAIESQPDNFEGYYHMACYYGRTGNPEQSLDYVRKAFVKGYWDWHHFSADTDIDCIRNLEGYSALEAGLKLRYDEIVAQLDRVFVIPDVGQAKKFETMDELLTAFRTDFFKNPDLLKMDDDPKIMAQFVALVADYLGAIGRMAHEQPDRAEDLALEELKFLNGEFGPLRCSKIELAVIDRVEQFKQRFAQSSRVVEALFYKAVFLTKRLATLTPQAQNQARPQAEASLREIVTLYPGTTQAGNAHVMLVEFEQDPKARIELIRRIKAEYQNDKKVMDTLWGNYQSILFQEFMVPDFTAVTLDGSTITKESLKGKVAILDFWATWCRPCMAQIPKLVELNKKHSSEELRIIGVSLDMKDKITDAAFQEFLNGHNMTWPQVYEGSAFESPLPQAFHIKGIPTYIVLDQQGCYVPMDLHNLDISAIDKLIAK